MINPIDAAIETTRANEINLSGRIVRLLALPPAAYQVTDSNQTEHPDPPAHETFRHRPDPSDVGATGRCLATHVVHEGDDVIQLLRVERELWHLAGADDRCFG